MKNLDNVWIEVRTNNGEILIINECNTNEVLFTCKNEGDEVEVILNKEDLERHIEICQMFLDYFKSTIQQS